MICKICGRTVQNEEANFCEYCGAPFRPEMDNIIHNMRDTPIQEKPMTVGNWLAIMLLVFIPLIGPYVFLALLFFWSFHKSVSAAKKNWARATLIVALILVALLFMLIGMTGGEILSDPNAILNYIYGK